jgi:hypothetical protein
MGSQRGALAGALVYGLTGQLSSFFENECWTVSGGLMPWGLLAVELAAGRGLGWAGLGALAVGGALLGGYHSVAVYGFGLITLDALLLAHGPLRRRLVGGALVLGLGLVIGLPRLAPALRELKDNSRVPIPFDRYFDETASLTPQRLLLLVAPDALGDPVAHTRWVTRAQEQYGNPEELRFTPGLVALAAVAAALARRRYALLALPALGILLVTLPTPLFWPFWRFVPGVGATSPLRILYFFPLACALVAAHGWTDLARGSRAAFVALGLAVLALGAMAAGAVPRSPTGAWNFDRALLKPVTTALAAFALVVFLGRARGKCQLVAQALLLGLLAFDLAESMVRWNPVGPAAALARESPMIRVARELAGDGRALADRGIPPGLLEPWGVRSVGSYNNSHPHRFARLLEAVAPSAAEQKQWLYARRLPQRWRDALAVRVVLADPAYGGVSVPEGLEPVRGFEPFLWSNPTALPRVRVFPASLARVVADESAAARAVAEPGFDPRTELVIEWTSPHPMALPNVAPVSSSTAQWLRDDADHLAVQVHTSVPSLLVVADAFSFGWTATLDGSPAEILPADLALRAVLVPAGEHEVALDFAPPDLAWTQPLGALAAFVAALLLAQAGLQVARKKTST